VTKRLAPAQADTPANVLRPNSKAAEPKWKGRLGAAFSFAQLQMSVGLDLGRRRTGSGRILCRQETIRILIGFAGDGRTRYPILGGGRRISRAAVYHSIPIE
jgi:hypothetical protein